MIESKYYNRKLLEMLQHLEQNGRIQNSLKKKSRELCITKGTPRKRSSISSLL